MYAFTIIVKLLSKEKYLYLDVCFVSLQKGLTDSCAEDYPGPRPESEVETRNIIKFFRSNSPIVGALDMHSYGQLILRPYGYTNQTAVDEKWMKELSTQMAAEIKKVSLLAMGQKSFLTYYPWFSRPGT